MKKALWTLAAMIVFGAIIRLTESDEARAKREAAEAAAEKQRTEERQKAEAERAEQERLGTEAKAKTIAQEFVKRVLKSPSTAQFVEAKAALKGDSWTVLGSVDSQNGFGAMIRAQYLCEVQKNGPDWTLVTPCVIESR